MTEYYVPHSIPNVISIAGGPSTGIITVKEGEEFQLSMTVSDSDTYERFKLDNLSNWTSQGLTVIPTNFSDVAELITSSYPFSAGPPNRSFRLPGGTTSGSVTVNYLFKAKSSPSFWTENPGAPFREQMDEFRPVDLENIGVIRDVIAPSNKKVILVRISRP